MIFIRAFAWRGALTLSGTMSAAFGLRYAESASSLRSLYEDFAARRIFALPKDIGRM